MPHDLVSAFKSTLQETTDATLLLHVIDGADDRKNENIDAVNQVLDEIEALEIPTLLVYNKVDRLDSIEPHIEYNDDGKPVAVYLSAQQNQGIDLLFEAMRVRLKNELVCERVLLPTTSGQIYTKFYQQQCIKSERFTEFGDRLVEIEVDKIQWQKWLKQYPELTEFVEFAKWEAES